MLILQSTPRSSHSHCYLPRGSLNTPSSRELKTAYAATLSGALTAPTLRLRFFNDPPLIAKYRVRWMGMDASRWSGKGSPVRRKGGSGCAFTKRVLNARNENPRMGVRGWLGGMIGLLHRTMIPDPSFRIPNSEFRMAYGKSGIPHHEIGVRGDDPETDFGMIGRGCNGVGHGMSYLGVLCK
jgi:hypothetical protein